MTWTCGERGACAWVVRQAAGVGVPGSGSWGGAAAAARPSRGRWAGRAGRAAAALARRPARAIPSAARSRAWHPLAPPPCARPPQAGAAGAPDGAPPRAAVQRHAAPEPAQRARVAQARQALPGQPHQADPVLHRCARARGGAGVVLAVAAGAGGKAACREACSASGEAVARLHHILAPAARARPPTEAVKTVDPDKAAGKPHTLWVAFARLYERHGDLPNARVIFEKAVQVRRGRRGVDGEGWGSRRSEHRPRVHACRGAAAPRRRPAVGSPCTPTRVHPPPRPSLHPITPAPPRPASSTWTTWPRCGASGPRWSCAPRTSAARSTSCAAPRSARPAPAPARCAARRAAHGWAAWLHACPARPATSQHFHSCSPQPALGTHPLTVPQEEAGLPVQDRLYRSLKLWSFYVDLEERWAGRGGAAAEWVVLGGRVQRAGDARAGSSPWPAAGLLAAPASDTALDSCAARWSRAPLPPTTLTPRNRIDHPVRSLGTLEGTKAAYEAVLDLRIATPQLVLNYAALLQEHKFFEEAFRWGWGEGGAATAQRG